MSLFCRENLGVRVASGCPLHLQLRGSLLCCCFGSWHPQRLGLWVSRRGGLGHRVPLRPTGIAGDLGDAALPPDPLPCTPTLLCRGYRSLILH